MRTFSSTGQTETQKNKLIFQLKNIINAYFGEQILTAIISCVFLKNKNASLTL